MCINNCKTIFIKHKNHTHALITYTPFQKPITAFAGPTSSHSGSVKESNPSGLTPSKSDLYHVSEVELKVLEGAGNV
eukprot:943749-Amorphochlora_amoeboformis.AAC.1